jgi:hypothetical protein
MTTSMLYHIYQYQLIKALMGHMKLSTCSSSTDDDSYLSSYDEEWAQSFEGRYFVAQNCGTHYQLCMNMILNECCNRRIEREYDDESDDQSSSTCRVSNIYDYDSSDSEEYSYSVTTSSDNAGINVNLCADLMGEAFFLMDSLIRNRICTNIHTPIDPSRSHDAYRREYKVRLDKLKRRPNVQETIILKSFRGHIPLTSNEPINTMLLCTNEMEKTVEGSDLPDLSMQKMMESRDSEITHHYENYSVDYTKKKQWITVISLKWIKRNNKIMSDFSESEHLIGCRTKSIFPIQTCSKWVRKMFFPHNNSYMILEDEAP